MTQVLGDIHSGTLPFLPEQAREDQVDSCYGVKMCLTSQITKPEMPLQVNTVSTYVILQEKQKLGAIRCHA